MQSVEGTLSSRRTTLKCCTNIEILWYRKLVTRASPEFEFARSLLHAPSYLLEKYVAYNIFLDLSEIDHVKMRNIAITKCTLRGRSLGQQPAAQQDSFRSIAHPEIRGSWNCGVAADQVDKRMLSFTDVDAVTMAGCCSCKSLCV